jgi:hypothetical protein
MPGKPFKLDEDLAARRDLLPVDKLLWAVLWGYWCDRRAHPPGLRTLAHAAGLSRRTATRALARLARAGLLIVAREAGGKRLNYAVTRGGHNGGAPVVATSGAPVVATSWPPVVATTGNTVTHETGYHGVATPWAQEVLRTDLREKGLSPSLLRAAEQIRSQFGRRLSNKELWHLNPLAVAGVSPQLLLDMAGTWGPAEPPWTFAGRVSVRWQEIVGAARALGMARERGEPHGLADGVVSSVRRYGNAAHIEWAFGVGEAGTIPPQQ